MKKIIQIIVFFVLASCGIVDSAVAQSCTAKAPAKVGLNQRFQLTVTIDQQNAKVNNPNFGSFTLVGGPSRGSQTSMTIMNGQQSVTHTITYTYVLQPTKVGKQTIPSITAVVDGKQVSSNSVTIEVTQEDQQSAQQRRRQQQQSVDPFDPFGFFSQPQRQPEAAKSDCFLKAYASKSTPYQGEEVVITYKFYFSNVYQFQVTGTDFPQQPDLWTYQLGNPNAEPTVHTETLNGKVYNVVEVYKTAVYPQKSGKITVTPLLMKGVMVVPSGWMGARKEDMSVRSNEVTLQVRELPRAGCPANFSGLVGKFSLKSNLTKNQLKANDATDLVVTISGSGNLQLVEPLDIAFPSDFDVNEPSVNDRIQTGGSSVNGSRTFDYTIIPRTAGPFTIPAADFCYFDPSSGTYKTLSTEKYGLTVDKGDDDNSFSSSSQKDIAVLDKDIRFIKTDVRSMLSPNKLFFATPAFFLLFFLPFLLLAVFLVIRRKQFKDRQNVAELRNRKANKVALKSLKKAKKLLVANKEDEFYVEISRALWGYMSDKFRIPLADLSIDSVRGKLAEKGVAPDDIEQFIQTLNNCEYARFAPDSGAAMMSDLYNQSLDFITKIEKQ